MTSPSARKEIEALVRLTQDAFDGDPGHSLLGNLREVRKNEWYTVPEGGGRSIADILEHVGWAKWMYEDHGFASASLKGDQPPMTPSTWPIARPRDELLEWINAGHRKWVASVRKLSDDSELKRQRLHLSGERMATRKLIHIMISHDLYHAGEINHLRCLIQGTDRWPYE